MTEDGLIEYKECKLAITEFLKVMEKSNRYSLYTDGNSLMFTHKDEVTNRPDYNLMFYFKKKDIEMNSYSDWLANFENRLSYPYDVKYNDKFQLLSEDGISRYDGDKINENIIELIPDEIMKEIYMELSKEVDKGYLLENNLQSFK